MTFFEKLPNRLYSEDKTWVLYNNSPSDTILWHFNGNFHESYNIISLADETPLFQRYHVGGYIHVSVAIKNKILYISYQAVDNVLKTPEDFLQRPDIVERLQYIYHQLSLIDSKNKRLPGLFSLTNKGLYSALDTIYQKTDSPIIKSWNMDKYFWPSGFCFDRVAQSHWAL